MGNDHGMLNKEKLTRMEIPRVEWLWNASHDGWSNHEKDGWARYSEIDNEIIEEAFRAKQDDVELDRYTIDLKFFVQRSREDPGKQRSVKRVVVDKEQQSLRERFSVVQKLMNPPSTVSPLLADLADLQPTKSFSDSGSSFPPFVDSWLKKYPDLALPDTVEQAVLGIISEGAACGLACEARWLGKELRRFKQKDHGEICRSCLSLYTRESFLYRVLNSTLRENDLTKIDTLGAFCYLLFYCPATEQLMKYHHKGLVYRGINLSLSDVADYENAIGNGYKCWLGFTSTSKSREKAEGFGNTLFIINIKYAIDSLDISSVSVFPEEQEVLLSASQLFKVDKVEYNEITKKHIISISIWWTIA